MQRTVTHSCFSAMLLAGILTAESLWNPANANVYVEPAATVEFPDPARTVDYPSYANEAKPIKTSKSKKRKKQYPKAQSPAGGNYQDDFWRQTNDMGNFNPLAVPGW